jgi:TRAP-type transport system periplasmic protein
MIRRRTLLQTGAATALGAPALVGLAQPHVRLKFHTFMPATSNVWQQLLKPWMDKVTLDSGGRIRFEAYPAMQLGGKPGQLFDQAKDGVVDIVWTLPGYTPGRFPSLEVFELPFMMTDAESTSRALWEFGQSAAAKELQSVQPLALHVHGPGLIHTRTHPIRTPDDLKDLKLRAPTRQVTKLLEYLGADPVGMPLTQVPEALSKGLIDGCVMPWESVPSTRVQHLTRYHSEFDPRAGALYTSVLMMCMNKARFNALPPELKYVLELNSGPDVSAQLGHDHQEGDAAGRKAALERGNRVYTITQMEAQAFRRKARLVEDEWVKEMAKRGLQGQLLLEKARQLITRHALHL